MESSIAYYDNVASEYNSQMTASDEAVRHLVQKIFSEKIEKGPVLDFGGGTGLDLHWLLRSACPLYFLEPSSNMRALAKKVCAGAGTLPVFVEDQVDFHLWSDQHLPFGEKMQAVLANFAVLNCIPDIECLFEKMAMICSQGCFFLATVLNTKPSKLLKTHSVPVALKSLVSKKLVSKNEFRGVCQKIFLHNFRAYRSASKKHFMFLSYDPIPFSDFAILTLRKK
jgi:ubiquinone/menaquinone biosynthesis C-methylase UbiE